MYFDQAPGDRGYQLYIVQIVMLIVAWILTSLRAYVKIHMLKNLTADDFLMFAAILLYTPYAAIAVWGIVQGGTGRLVHNSTLAQTVIGLEAWWICEVLYPIISALVRTSVALFILRIANSRSQRIAIYVIVAVVWIMSLLFFFACIFQCSPVTYFWQQYEGMEGSCIDPRFVPNVVIAQSAVCAVCDFALAALPIWMLWNVKLNRRTKAAVAILLSMGFIAGIALIVRIPYIRILTISPEFLYTTIDVGIWSVLEPALGMIAGCIATLRPLFKSWGIGHKTSKIYSSGRKYANRLPARGNHSGVHTAEDKEAGFNYTSTSDGSHPQHVPRALSRHGRFNDDVDNIELAPSPSMQRLRTPSMFRMGNYTDIDGGHFDSSDPCWRDLERDAEDSDGSSGERRPHSLGRNINVATEIEVNSYERPSAAAGRPVAGVPRREIPIHRQMTGMDSGSEPRLPIQGDRIVRVYGPEHYSRPR